MPLQKILLIEDDDDAYQLLSSMLVAIGYSHNRIVRRVQLAGIASLEGDEFEIVLTDLSLPDSHYSNTFGVVQEKFPYTPVIVFTISSEIDVAIKTIQQGAQDYLIKGQFGERVLDKAIKYAIERKKRSNDYLRLFEDSPVPMYIFESESCRFLAVNSAALNQYGYSREEFLSMSAEDIRPQEDVGKFRDVIKTVPETYYDAGAWRHIKKDGTVFYVHVYTHSTVFEGKAARMVLPLDIDERLKVENAFKEKVQEREYILESITDGFFTINANWQLTYANSEFERVLKCNRDEIIGRSIWDIFPEAVGTRFYDEYHRAIAENSGAHFEAYYAPLDIWVSQNVYPVNGGLVVYFLDITEQKKNLDKIFIDGQNLRAIINNTRDIIWSIDRDHNIISANQAFWNRIQTITGKTEREINQNDFSEGLFENWREYYERAFQGELFKLIWTEENGGKTIYEDISFNPIFDNAKNVIGVSCFSRDITEQRNHLNMIELQNKQLKDIAWIQSHEVRSPVASILGLVQLINKQDPGSPSNMEILEKIGEAAQLLDGVIKKITELAAAKNIEAQ